MTGFLEWINPFNKALDVVDQFVEDKDKSQALKLQLTSLMEETYRTELQTRTIPWVDAVHKLARPVIIPLAQMLFFGLAYGLDWGISDWTIAAIGGQSAAYTLIKGKGRK